MRVLLARGLDQFLHDVRGRGTVRIAHAKVDNVVAALACGGLQVSRDVEDVGRQALDALEISAGSRVGHGLTRVPATTRNLAARM